MHSQEQSTINEGFAKGDTFITGSVSIITQKQDNVKNTGFSAGPSVGYFISDNIALGARVNYLYQKTEGGDFNPEYEQNAITGGLFGRYYFTPKNKFSLFAQLGADYNRYEREMAGNNREKSHGFGVSAGPGFNYFITPHLALQSFLGAVSYGTNTQETDGESTENRGFSLNLDFSNVYFGLTYKF